MNYTMTELDHYWIELMDLSSLIKEWGAKTILQDMKISFPKAYEDLVFAMLDELPK